MLKILQKAWGLAELRWSDLKWICFSFGTNILWPFLTLSPLSVTASCPLPILSFVILSSTIYSSILPSVLKPLISFTHLYFSPASHSSLTPSVCSPPPSLSESIHSSWAAIRLWISKHSTAPFSSVPFRHVNPQTQIWERVLGYIHLTLLGTQRRFLMDKSAKITKRHWLFDNNIWKPQLPLVSLSDRKWVKPKQNNSFAFVFGYLHQPEVKTPTCHFFSKSVQSNNGDWVVNVFMRWACQELTMQSLSLLIFEITCLKKWYKFETYLLLSFLNVFYLWPVR